MMPVKDECHLLTDRWYYVEIRCQLIFACVYTDPIGTRRWYGYVGSMQNIIEIGLVYLINNLRFKDLNASEIIYRNQPLGLSFAYAFGKAHVILQPNRSRITRCFP